MNSISKRTHRSQCFKTLLSVFCIYQLLQTSQANATSWILSKEGNPDLVLPKGKSVEGSGTINGLAWQDNNQNGQQDTSELPIAGMKINLWLFDDRGTSLSFQDSATTNNLGQYEFRNLRDGNYIVEFSFDEVFRINFEKFTDVNIGADETDSDVGSTGFSKTVALNDSVQKVDAGLIPKPFSQGSIGDFVWLDANRNGQQDTNEQVVSGVSVTLWLFDTAGTSLTKIDSATTNGFGSYSFKNLNKGNYVVEFSLPENSPGFTEANVGSELTDSDVGPRGFTQLIAIDPLDATKRHFEFIDAGLLPKPTLQGSIGDFVWLDSNKNGQQDADEQPIEGIGVALWLFDVVGTSLTKVDTTITDVNGKYQFSGLQNGKYVVEFMLNEKQKTVYEGFTTANVGMKETDSDVGPRGFTTSISVETATEGQKDIKHIDAGLVKKTVSQVGLGNLVWQDSNKNGQQDEEEKTVAGMNVALWKFDERGTSLTKIDSNVTDTFGNFYFNDLNKGNYIVEFVLNETHKADFEGFTTADFGSDDTDSDAGRMGFTHSIAIDPTNPSQSLLKNISAGLIPRVSTLGSISDIIWQDTNKDGHHDATEPPVADIKVKLWAFDTMGTSLTEVDSAVTKANGEYHFNGLPKGEYIVQFTLNELQQTRYETVTATTTRSASSVSRSNPNAGILNFPVSVDPLDPAMRDINTVSNGLIPKSGCNDICLPVTIKR